ncbi:MAG: hypothetical protein ACYDEV_14880 [Acidiferrobacter sp.]
MTRLTLIGSLALTIGTVASIWMSVAIPNAQRLRARALTAHALHVAQTAATYKSGSGPTPSALDARDLRVHAQTGSTHTTVQVTFRNRAEIPTLLRGAELTVSRANGLWRCRASGGHGAWAGDFPTLCHYVVHRRLI